MIRNWIRSFNDDRLAWFWLAAVAGLTSFLRWHGFDAPLHTDICVYAMMGTELLQGGQLYHTLLDNKPPGIYFFYMLAIRIAGDAPLVFNALGLLFILLAQFFIFLILKRMASSLFGLLGAFLWGIVTLSIPIWANHPHTEVFINAFLLLAVWGMVARLQGVRHGLWWTGLGLGLASVMKTNVFFVFLTLFVFFVVLVWQGRRRGEMVPGWKEAVCLIAPPLTIWAGVVGYFLVQGTLPEFFDIVFKSLRAYAGNIFVNQIEFFFVWKKHPPIYQHLFLVTILVTLGWGLGKSLQRRLTRVEAVVLFYLGGCLLMIGSLDGLYILYFQIFLPPLTLLSTLFFYEIRTRARRFFVPAMIGMVLVVGVYGLRYLSKTPEQISIEQYGDVLLADRKLGDYIQSITEPDDRVYQWGMNAHLNYYSCRKSPVGLIQNHLLDFSPDAIQFKIKNKTFDALMKAPPEMIIFAAWIGDFRSNMFYQALWPNYTYFGCYDKYLIFIRKSIAVDPRADPEMFRMITEKSHNTLGTARLLTAAQSRKLFDQGKLITGKESRDFLTLEGKDRFEQTINQGVRLARAGKWHAAMEIWAKAHDIKRLRPESFANLGIYHEYMGSYYLALQNYAAAAQQLDSPWDDYYRSARMRMVHELHLLEDRSPAAPRLKRNLVDAKDQTDYAQLIQAGNQAARKFRWETARKHWEQALQLDDREIAARANLALYYEIHYEFQKALEFYRVLAQQQKNPWETYRQEVESMLETLPKAGDSPTRPLR
ncbi:glycosyltransferase family 39 protein [bacterium]|nr:glycosyltransferase family 39 protein [bacterium]